MGKLVKRLILKCKCAQYILQNENSHYFKNIIHVSYNTKSTFIFTIYFYLKQMYESILPHIFLNPTENVYLLEKLYM